jgi:hypothetical protein
MNNITITLDLSRYPLLKDINTENINDVVYHLIDIGYDMKFRISANQSDSEISSNEPVSMESSIYSQMSLLNKRYANTECSISELNTTLHKLIGISSNSIKKGCFAEGIIEHTFKNRYGDIRFEQTASTSHSADAWLHLPDEEIIMLESKNYTNTVAKKELDKFENDMIAHNIRWGIMISFNSGISGMRELDYHVFTHNKQTFVMFIISNIQNVDDFHRLLDLGLQLLRRHIQLDKEDIKLDFVVSDITSALNELQKLIAKNNILRDAFYTMEREIHKSINEYYGILRNFQYEIETSISNIVKKIDNVKEDTKTTVINTMNNSGNQNKEISHILSRVMDVCTGKGLTINKDTEGSSTKLLLHDGKTSNLIGLIKIQAKKVIVALNESDIEIAFSLGKEKSVVKNLDILRNFNL